LFLIRPRILSSSVLLKLILLQPFTIMKWKIRKAGVKNNFLDFSVAIKEIHVIHHGFCAIQTDGPNNFFRLVILSVTPCIECVD